MIEQIEAWLEQLPPGELAMKSEGLVTVIRAKRRALEAARHLLPRPPKPRKGPNYAREQAKRRKEVAASAAWKDDIRGSQADWRDRCKSKMAQIALEQGYAAYGLYLRAPASTRAPYRWRAAWQRPNNAGWVETLPLTYEPSPLSQPGYEEEKAACMFSTLYETLDLPRVPLAPDLAWMVMDF
jgi:hypothetical protein